MFSPAFLHRRTACAFALLVGLMANSAMAQLELGGAHYQEPGWSYSQSGLIGTLVTSTGTGISFGSYTGSTGGSQIGFRWTFGGPGEQLRGNPNSSGNFDPIYIYDGNNLGNAVGYFNDRDSSGAGIGRKAGFWGSGSDVIELASLNDGSRAYDDVACGINNAGTIVGQSWTTSGIRQAVRWNSSSSAPVELESLGTDLNGYSESRARDVNRFGTAVGYSTKYSATNDYLGVKAVRWNSGSTTPVELDSIAIGGVTPDEVYHEAYLVNSSNISAGVAEGYNGTFSLRRAVRWNASGNATVLDDLQVSVNGESYSSIRAMNELGAASGSSAIFDNSGNYLGDRAVRWSAFSPAVQQLQHPSSYGTDNDGRSSSFATGINNAGLTVGYIEKYDGSGNWDGSAGSIWLLNGTHIDANTLNPVPVEGIGSWDIQRIDSITTNGWVGGYGIYTASSGITYGRAFTAQIGLGGIWTVPTVPTVGAPSARWGDGDNWETGTPALRHGNARFATPGTHRIRVDEDVLTNSVSFEQGDVYLELDGSRLQSREGFIISSGARAMIRSAFHAGTGRFGSLDGDVLNEGTLSAGNSPGLLLINGNLFNSGELLFEIAGTGASEYDQILLNGEFLAGGNFSVALLDGFNPSEGDSFQLMQFGSFSFDNMQFDFSRATLAQGLQWDTSRLWSDGSLFVSAVPEPGAVAILCLATGVSVLVRRRRVLRSAGALAT
jgi:hypothetical protein